MKSCGLVLLAAGASTRLNQPKQLLSYKGKTLLARAINTGLEALLQRVVVVFGANAHLLRDEVIGLPVHIVYNEQWNTGMSSSVSSGIAALLKLSPGIENVILMVCDQPFVTASLLNELLARREESGKGIVACAYNNTYGTPVLFNNKYFDELLLLQGAQGAKKIIGQYPGDVESVDFPMGSVDVDTLADYEALISDKFPSSGNLRQA